MTTVTWAGLASRFEADLSQIQSLTGMTEVCKEMQQLGVENMMPLVANLKTNRAVAFYQVTSVIFTVRGEQISIHLVVWQFWGRAAVGVLS
jgi:hypothetical protein